METKFSLSQVNPTKQLFGNDVREGIHWGKLFFYLSNSYYSTHSIYGNFQMDEIIKHLRNYYEVPDCNIIENVISKPHAILECENECSEYFLVVKNGLCISITEPLVTIMYSSCIAKPEVGSILLLVNENTLELGNSKKLLKVKN